jgi:hypothetical protein
MASRSSVTRNTRRPCRRLTAIVRQIFELPAKGRGLTTIAKTLNHEGAPAPRAQQGRPAAWAPSSVHEVLYRTVYRGEIIGTAPGSATRGDRWRHRPGRSATGLACRLPTFGSWPTIYGTACRSDCERDGPHTSGERRVNYGDVPPAAWSPSTCCRDWRAAPAMGACTSRAGATAGSVRTSMAARHSISAGAASVRTASRSPWSAPTTLSSTSLVYSFDNPKAPTRRPVQYFELVGNRAIYQDGWPAPHR